MFTTQNCAREDWRQVSSLWTLDRGIDIHAEDPEHTGIDNEITHSSDTTVALGGSEAEGHPKDLVYNHHNKLTVLMREINHLHQ